MLILPNIKHAENISEIKYQEFKNYENFKNNNGKTHQLSIEVQF